VINVGTPWRQLMVLSLLLLTGCFGCQSRPAQIVATPVALPAPPVVSATPLPTPTPIAASALQKLATADQLELVVVPARDLRDLTLRLKPDVNEIPQVVHANPPSYQVGDQRSFWVHNVETTQAISITAQLIYLTDVAYVWVESGQEYDAQAIQKSVDRFSQQSYPAEVAFFGHEWNPGVDNAARLHILHAAQLGGGIAGYFSSADEYSRLANPYSNEQEMFYINLAWLNASDNYPYYETVLAHELQHMIHWHNDSNESTWINEGLSEYAQEVAGYGSDITFVSAFTNNPNTQLNAWEANQNSNAAHYGAAYLFIHYYTQRFGAQATTALVAEPANGIAGVERALISAGTGLHFEDLFADWVVANYANQPDALGLAGVYGYRNIQPARPSATQRDAQTLSVPLTGTVNNYATDYIQLTTSGALTLSFSGQQATRLAAMDAHSGQFAWWSNRSDDADSRLTRQFDLRSVQAGTPISMSAALWWEIEDQYDFAYVTASRDGRKWQILPGSQSTTANASGNSFGAGYTGSSATVNGGGPAWRTESFDLSAYAGEQPYVRFEYVTDDAVSQTGWLLDDLRIPAIGYATSFEPGESEFSPSAEGAAPEWQSEGWLLTDNQLAQRWLIQVLEFTGDQLTAVRRLPVGADGQATLALGGLGGEHSTVLAISALAPVTTEPANYELQITQP
jgi:immune inhibitor A